MKEAAYQFLKRLHTQLDIAIGPPSQVRGKVVELMALATQDPKFKFYCGAEHTFTRGIALPAIFRKLTTTFEYAPDHARAAIYAEGFGNFPDLSINTPARLIRHPFSKALVNNAQDLYAQWSGRAPGAALKQSCPDFALRDPFPHNIVFEAKYFQGRSSAAAERELVATAYQAFFYRGLPETDTSPDRPWGYDYAVAFVYDASSEGHFEKAWQDLPTEVKAGFWGGANVYVMVLRGRPDPHSLYE